MADDVLQDDFIIYIPTQDSKPSIVRVRQDFSAEAVEAMQVHVLNDKKITMVPLAEVAYMRLRPGKKEFTEDSLVADALKKGLEYIPRHFIQVARRQKPDVTMSDIRRAFTKTAAQRADFMSGYERLSEKERAIFNEVIDSIFKTPNQG